MKTPTDIHLSVDSSVNMNLESQGGAAAVLSMVNLESPGNRNTIKCIFDNNIICWGMSTM